MGTEQDSVLQSTLIRYGQTLAGAKRRLKEHLDKRYSATNEMYRLFSRLIAFNGRSINDVAESARYRQLHDEVLNRVRAVLDKLGIFDSSTDLMASSDDLVDEMIYRKVIELSDDGVGDSLHGMAIDVFVVATSGFLGFENFIERTINNDWRFFAHLTDCRTHVLPFGKNGDLPVTVHQLTYMVNLEENR